MSRSGGTGSFSRSSTCITAFPTGFWPTSYNAEGSLGYMPTALRMFRHFCTHYSTAGEQSTDETLLQSQGSVFPVRREKPFSLFCFWLRYVFSMPCNPLPMFLDKMFCVSVVANPLPLPRA